MKQNRRPNVVLCVCDQLRAFEAGCYGNAVIRTPNIDRLAAGGVRFDVACSNNPICCPARAILLTGQHSRTCTGMRGNVGEPDAVRRHMPGTTIAEAFSAAGYDTASIGKWHVQPPPDAVGFDTFLRPAVPHRHSGRTFYHDSTAPFTADGWSWDFEMNHVRDFLAGRARASTRTGAGASTGGADGVGAGDGGDKPFFLYFNIEPPHMPLADAPEEFLRMYRPEDVPLRPNVFVDGKLAYDAEWFKVYRWDYLYYREHLPETEALPPGFDLRHLTALYYGLTTLMDRQVGRLCAALQAAGLAEDTLLIFVSDHGDNLGSHGSFNKYRLIEESIRIPLIYHWPAALKPAVARQQVTSLIDVMPTALALAGIPVPEGVQGSDVSPVVRGEQQTIGENAAYLECIGDGGSIGIRTRDHLYAATLRDPSTYEYQPANDEVADDRAMFFDLRDDPYEMNNLAKADAQPDVARDLRERLLRWHRQTPWLRTLTPRGS